MFPVVPALVATVRTTVVMIHGAGGGGWEYDQWRPVFEKSGYRVVARDLVPAKGGLAGTQFRDYVDQVISWSPKKGKVILVGASMGGVIALKAAEKIKPHAIVLVNSVPPYGVFQMPFREPVPDVMRWANGPLKDTVDSMPDSDRKTILWAWRRWRDESGAVMNQMFTGVIVDKPRCPSLIVLGEKDTDVPHEAGLALAAWCGGEVKSYKGVSHVGPLMSRRAKEVARDIVGWLKGIHSDR